MNLKVYSKPNCPQCQQLKAFLTAKEIQHETLTLGTDYSKEDLLVLAPAARALPQLFDGAVHIGGYNAALEYVREKASAI